MQGEGLIYPVSETDIVVPPFERSPITGRRSAALDFGWTPPDRGSAHSPMTATTISSTSSPNTVRPKTQTDQHVINLKPWGAHLKWAWPHDGEQVNDRGYGIATSQIYRNCRPQDDAAALRVSPPIDADGSSRLSRTSVERGIQDILDRMRNGTFKVFSEIVLCGLRRRRLYHRKDNKIVEEEDDLMDATRVAIMSLRHASIPKPPSRPVRRPPNWRAV